MKRVAKFEKVSYEQFKKDFVDIYKDSINKVDISDDGWIRRIYNNIKLPKRATSGSAGYDFFLPVAVDLYTGRTAFLPTGIKCKMNDGYVLKIYPRSGLGFKYRIQLNNTVGIIDSDYYNNKNNEGHIMAKITNDSNEGKGTALKAGDAFMQGIFVEYGITVDDDVSEIREGGLGSTSAN